jgi:hypothetical protein
VGPLHQWLEAGEDTVSEGEGRWAMGQIQCWAEMLPRGLLTFFIFSFLFSFDLCLKLGNNF